jgi:hypothetical protein
MTPITEDELLSIRSKMIGDIITKRTEPVPQKEDGKPQFNFSDLVEEPNMKPAGSERQN